MKKTLAIAACIISVLAVFAGCEAADGRVDDNRNSVVSRTDNNRTVSERLMDSDRRTALNDNTSAVSAADRDRINNNNNNNNGNDNEGVIHDVGSMVGQGIEDVADGVDNIGSSINSNINDAANGDENTDNM